jgi:hypothetical protein
MIDGLRITRRATLIGVGGLLAGGVGWFYWIKRRSGNARLDIEKVMGTTVMLSLIDLPAFDQRLIPAYAVYLNSSDTSGLVALVKDAISSYAAEVNRVPDLPSLEVWQEYLDILTGKVFYSSEGTPHDQLRETSSTDLRILIDNSIGPALMRFICIPNNLRAVEQDMSHRQLMMYLYDHSRLVEDYFTFATEPTGRTPQIKLGEWSRFFSPDEVRRLDQEVSKVPRPEDRNVIDGGFDNLRSLLQTAVVRSDLGLLVTVL